MKAVAFAGGGAKGAAAAAEYLRRWPSGTEHEIISGESIGAMNGYLLAIGGPVELVEHWKGIRARDIFRGGSGLDKAATLMGFRRGIYDMRPSIDTLRRLVHGRRIRPGLRVLVNVTDLETGALLTYALSEKDDPERCFEICYRSTLVPIAHGAKDGRWADGGISGTAPMGPCVAAGADHVDVILLDELGTSRAGKITSAVQEAGRAVDIIRENQFFGDLEGTWLRNRLARVDPSSGYRVVGSTHYEPNADLLDWMDFSELAVSRRLHTTFTGRGLDATYSLASQRRGAALSESLSLH